MENVDKEIQKMLQEDLYIIEAEEIEKENVDLSESNKELKQTIEKKETEYNETIEEYDMYSVDIEQLLEYLGDNGELTDKLKQSIEYFVKFIR